MAKTKTIKDVNTTILPLGTIVTLKNSDGSKLLIISRASIVQPTPNQEVYYDYASVLLPQGMVNPETMFFFNKENVQEVLHLGYIDEEEQDYQDNYDQLLSGIDIPKGDVD